MLWSKWKKHSEEFQGDVEKVITLLDQFDSRGAKEIRCVVGYLPITVDHAYYILPSPDVVAKKGFEEGLQSTLSTLRGIFPPLVSEVAEKRGESVCREVHTEVVDFLCETYACDPHGDTLEVRIGRVTSLLAGDRSAPSLVIGDAYDLLIVLRAVARALIGLLETLSV